LLMKKSKNKIQIDYSTGDIYKHYCETTKNPLGLGQKKFNQINKEFFGIVVDKMINENFELTFPRRLGNIKIIKYKVKPKLNEWGNLDKRQLSIDYAGCKKLWKEMYPDKTLDEIYQIQNKPLVFHMNKHSNGYRCRWWWDKRTCLVKNAMYYKFDMCRSNDRKLAKELKDPGKILDFYTKR